MKGAIHDLDFAMLPCGSLAVFLDGSSSRTFGLNVRRYTAFGHPFFLLANWHVKKIGLVALVGDRWKHMGNDRL